MTIVNLVIYILCMIMALINAIVTRDTGWAVAAMYAFVIVVNLHSPKKNFLSTLVFAN